ncbi:AzlC family ABC transporter permease [Frigidibacter oleivorans]|uniref:AzlC family ABC transporter permease n=1 Tax=Frigidibacter oleivorans TaxID=2487129 RepID=UPI001F25C78D|nr:AzlC family ABC transporter permease [Frigidibacter oleivorans]
MPSLLHRPTFRRGLREALPFILMVAPFGLLFGVVAQEAGLDLYQTMAMTILVIAGSSQFAAAQMIADNAPALIVLATALAVNLRMAMYSASLTPHLGQAPTWQRALVAYLLIDQAYALASVEYDKRPAASLPDKLAYFFGTMTVIAPVWYGATWLGATVGAAIPPWLALDFAVPITFLAMVAPMLRTLPHLAAATMSVVASLALAWMPHNTGLLAASALAMMAGAQAELWLSRHKLRRGPEEAR